MKKILVVSALLLAGNLWAIDVFVASNTVTADTAQRLCPKNYTTRQGHGVLDSVCVNTGAAGTFTVYNASGAAVNPIAAIDTAAKGCMNYDVGFSSGLTYSNSATANVTVSYTCN